MDSPTTASLCTGVEGIETFEGPREEGEGVEETKWREAYRQEENEDPSGDVRKPALMHAFATMWMLREVELAAIHKEDITIDPKERIVVLNLRATKGDQEALGLKRTCDWTEPCPFNITKAPIKIRGGRPRADPPGGVYNSPYVWGRRAAPHI